jgi:hypothetical protein
VSKLIDYIFEHAERGECQCGSCIDKGPEREPAGHSVDMVFFWVSAKNNPTAEELRALLEAEYPSLDRLAEGPSYIEIGAEIGDQGAALMLIGLGELVGLWQAVTPRKLLPGADDAVVKQLAGNGMLMCSGLRPTPVAA